MGLFALALRFLDWKQAALCAAIALAFNGSILPLVGGKRLHKEGEEGSHWSAGILVYPATVLALILLFRHRLEIAAASWGLLAAGDAAASIAGRSFSPAPLPWNRDKSWAGFFGYLLAGFVAAGWLLFWVAPGKFPGFAVLLLAFVGALAGAIVESLPTKLDDNATAPLAGGAVMGLLAPTLAGGAVGWALFAAPENRRALLVAVGVNAAVAILATAAKLLRPSGVVAGFVVGTVILAAGGWPGYAILWTFFALGTAATKWKYAEKAKRGAAQEGQGKRGAKHAVANCAAGAFLLMVAAGASGVDSLERMRALLLLGFVAAFATALADTFGSEIGSALGRQPRLITTWKPVPPGTDGAVSVPGTVGGLVGAAIVAGVGLATGLVSLPLAACAVAGGFLGTTIESVLGATLESKNWIDNEVQNFLNTVIGAAFAVLLAGAFHA